MNRPPHPSTLPENRNGEFSAHGREGGFLVSDSHQNLETPFTNHSGRGPKGYRRSDERILEEVCEALLADEHIDASGIEVSVEKGVVTLKGFVSERSMKRAAEDTAERIAGIEDIQNEVRVIKSSGSDSRESEESTTPKPSLLATTESRSGPAHRPATLS